MTAKEAIMILESIQPSCGEKYSFSESEIYEAIDMAIEALNHSEIPNSSEPKCANGCIYGWGSSECGHCDYRSEESKTGDTISRKAAIDEIEYELEMINSALDSITLDFNTRERLRQRRGEAREILNSIQQLPPAQPERDIPVKPNETIDKAWGIPKRQAVCPKCDYYLGHVAFLGDYKGKRITYCEVCGQAIDWEGWKFDE